MQEDSTSNLSYNFIYCIYLPVAFYYSLILVNDCTSNLLLILTLISLTSIFSNHNHRYILIALALLSLTDFGLKIALSLGFDIPLMSRCLNYEIVKDLIYFSEESLNEASLAYLSMIMITVVLPFSYNGHRTSRK